jgi:hypothetical protein
MSLVIQNEVNSLLVKLRKTLNVGLPNSINKSGLTGALNAQGRARVGSSAANASANFSTKGIDGIQNIDITVLNVTNIQTNGTTSSGAFVFNANFKSRLTFITHGSARYKFLFNLSNVGLHGQTIISNSAVMATGSFSVTETNNQIKINTFNFTGFNLHFGNIQPQINIQGSLAGLRNILRRRVGYFIRSNSIQQLHMEAQNELKAIIQQQINTEIKSI